MDNRKASEPQAAADATSAALARVGASAVEAAMRGAYRVSCMRVVEAHQEHALLLAERIRQAEALGLRATAQSLTEELRTLPREEVWQDEIANIVTTVGRNDMADKYLAGSAWTTTIFMGLKGAGSAVAGDTQASHAGWSEVGGTNAPAYSGNRPVPTLSAASGGVKQTASAVSFTFTSGGTVAGCFINVGGSNTKDATTGVLFSAGDFTGGSKTVANTDVLNVTWSLTLTSS